MPVFARSFSDDQLGAETYSDAEGDDEGLVQATQELSLSLVESMAPRQYTGFLSAKWAESDDLDLEFKRGRNKRTRSSSRSKTTRKGKEKATKDLDEPQSRNEDDPNTSSDPGYTSDGRPKKAVAMGYKSAKPGSVRQSLGVRALLSEWTIGDDPNSYIFTPIASTLEEGIGSQSQSRARSQGDRDQRASRPTSSQRRPAVSSHPSFSLVPNQSQSQSQSQRTGPSTQPSFPPSFTQPSHSQPQLQSISQSPAPRMTFIDVPILSSTQVLPGPFGGRPEAPGGKKVVKKKKAGF